MGDKSDNKIDIKKGPAGTPQPVKKAVKKTVKKKSEKATVSRAKSGKFERAQ